MDRGGCKTSRSQSVVISAAYVVVSGLQMIPIQTLDL